MLLEAEDAISMIGEKIRGRKYYVILSCSEQSIALASAIEEAHYLDEAAADFEMYLVTRPVDEVFMAAIFLAKKTRMSTKDLAKLMNLPKEAVPGDRDVLLTPDIPLAAFEWFERTFRKYGEE